MRLSFENLCFSYDSDTRNPIPALDNVSLELCEGEFIGIIGHTGSGKSTLLQVAAGLLKPESGRVLLDGEDIYGRDFKKGSLSNRVGIVFQNPERQLFESSVERDIAFGPRQAGLPRDEIAARVRWAMQAVGLDYERFAELSPLSLSGGEKRKAAIAGILSMKPELLILDEPIAGLDAPARTSLMELLKQLNQTGVTVLMVSHGLDELCEYAGRIILLDHGRVTMDGTPHEVFANAEHLKAMRMGISQAQECAIKLRSKGLPISDNIVSHDELLKALRGALADRTHA